MFHLTSPFTPTGDQPQAIEKLAEGVKKGLKNQVLLGVTGSGKTFTMANVIQKLQMPALVISHNKTQAGQLYQEMREFFPNTAVSYFVSYYDFYQPEAYIPATDTYIEKEAEINELIDKLRLQATTNIMTRKDTIVVASVSCIYNIGSPAEYNRFTLTLRIGEIREIREIGVRLVELLYERSEYDFKRGTFRVRGNYMDIYPAYEDYGYRVGFDNNVIGSIEKFEPLTGKVLNQKSKIKNQKYNSKLKNIIIYPAKHYITDRSVLENTEATIRKDLLQEVNELKRRGKLLEAERLLRRVNYDLEIVKEIGYVNGIENYSRYFDGRKQGEPPYTLLDYFSHVYGQDFLVFIDESHMTVPQIRGMYNGDYARKKTLIEFGFRMNAALDNRPLRFEEFYRIPQHFVYVSATPGEWETNASNREAFEFKVQSIRQAQDKSSKFKVEYNGIAEQLVRPTGIVDPKIIVRPAKTEVTDLIREIEKRVNDGEKILVTTLTKKNAEDLSEYLKEKKFRTAYLHSDIQTLERSDVLDNLRKNEFDVLIGVNLLREGLDLPEVSLVAILDADREGFLRSKTSLIQTMGRASRNIKGEVILYADEVTNSMRSATDEIERRRAYQLAYNEKFGVTPQTVYKPVRERIIEAEELTQLMDKRSEMVTTSFLDKLKTEAMTPYDKKKWVKRLEKEMRLQADDLNFEMAIQIRDKIREIKS